ncbi:hypothetical protein H6P81_010210 [Aristolochia fimbriata]|uniref:Aminotransferase-like plant mobile domain-containing protein n=1 Tax=Aristolochia fimbriata TaxID=158543 RepID=A0AAV7EN66_ARIFI|nr:hypothetical protein H6P81_010210 [Aristolochia fimbriata]
MVEFFVQWSVDVHSRTRRRVTGERLGQVKYGFQSMLELFVKRDTYSYEMDSRRSLENVGGSGEGAVVVYGGQAPAEGDDRVESPNAEFIPEEREPCEDANDDSSSEESWPNPVREEVEEEEEDVELPLPTMGVPPLEENDAPYPDPWIGVMDMDVTYRNTMVPGVDDDNVPPPIGIGVGQKFMTKDALVMHLKDYCISRHVQFRVVMADTPLLYDQDSHRSESIWHGEDQECLECTEHFQTLRHWPMDERMLPYVEAAGFGALHRVQWLRLDKQLITALVERWRSETNTFHLANGEMTITLEDVAVLLGLRVDGDVVTWSTRGDWMELARVLLGVTPPEDVEHVTRISRKGRAGEDWTLYHRDYIARWEARAEYVITGSRAHTPRHAPSAYMRWYLGVTRRYIAPPPTEPAMVYHPRGYTEEALLGCVRNVVERVNHRAALYPSSTDPHWLEIGQYCQSVLHSLPLLEGAIVGEDESPAGEPSPWSKLAVRESSTAASCKASAHSSNGDFVLRNMTRFQPHRAYGARSST